MSRESADCAIGRDAAQLVLSGFEGFRDDYVNHVQHHRCLASLQNPVPCVSLCPAGDWSVPASPLSVLVKFPNSISVVVCWKDSLQLVEQIKQNGPSYSLMKKLAKYTVGVRETDFNALLSAGAVEKVLEGLYVVSDAAAYNHKSGLSTNNHWLDEVLYI